MRDGALTAGGREQVERQDRGRLIGEAKPLQAGQSQQGRGEFAAFDLAQAGLDIAAQQLDLKIRAAGA